MYLFRTHSDKAHRILTTAPNVVPQPPRGTLTSLRALPAHPRYYDYEDMDDFKFAVATACLRDCMSRFDRIMFLGRHHLGDYA